MRYLQYEDSGRIIAVGNAPDDSDFSNLKNVMLHLPENINLEGMYVDKGELKQIPTKPGEFYKWDWKTKTWLADIDSAKKAKKTEVEQQRSWKSYLPITYLGHQFDADLKAQSNISGWQTQIAAGIQIPSGFVWRDYNNVDHPADADFINGLGAAIALRTSRLYQAAWKHKAAIDALSTVEALEKYDVSTGWEV